MSDSIIDIIRRILHLERRVDRLESLETPVIGGGGAGAPANARYVVMALHAGLTNEEVLTEGPDIDLVSTGANGTITVGRGGDTVLLFDSGGSPVAEYAATQAGVIAALAAATAGDIVECPHQITIALTAAITIPASVTLKNAHLTFSGFGGIAVTLSNGSALEHFNIVYDGVGQANATGVSASGIATATLLIGDVLVENATNNTGVYLAGSAAGTYIHATLVYGDARNGTNNVGVYIINSVFAEKVYGYAAGGATTNIGVQFATTTSTDPGFFQSGWGKAIDAGAYGMDIVAARWGKILDSWMSGATDGLRVNAGSTAQVRAVHWTSFANAGTITYLPGDRLAGGLTNWYVVTDYGAVGDGVTDDTVAIQATIDACEAGCGGVVYFPAGVYIVGGALQDGARGNAQLLLPDIDTTGKQIGIMLLGEANPNVVPSLTGAITLPDCGSVIEGTLNAGAGGALLGGWGPIGSYLDFTLLNLRIENLHFQMPDNPVLTALNLDHVESVEIVNVAVHTGNYRVSTVTQPTTVTSYGVKTPRNNNGAWTYIRELLILGFYNGIQINEHTNVDHIEFFACYYAAVIPAAGHAARIGRMMVHWCRNGMQFTGLHHLTIELYNVEHSFPSGAWYDNVLDIDDASNFGIGPIVYHSTISGSGADDPIAQSGGGLLHVYKIEDAFGAASPYSHYEVLMAPGVTPPDPILTVGETDWIWVGV